MSKIRVSEIFGPTIQGEGVVIGRPTMFVRIAGCDYRCSWCDSMHAVDPVLIKKTAVLMEPDDISLALLDLSTLCKMVTISGGNPVMYDLQELERELHRWEYTIAVETQGSIYRDWLLDCDIVTVSPKGPSSGMTTDWKVLDEVLRRCATKANIKVVVFDDDDIVYARLIRSHYPKLPFTLQVGTRGGLSLEESRLQILTQMESLTERVLKDDILCNCTILPQLHTLMWGSRLGV